MDRPRRRIRPKTGPDETTRASKASMPGMILPDLVIHGAFSLSLFGLWALSQAIVGFRLSVGQQRILRVGAFALVGWLTLWLSLQPDAGLRLDPRGAVIGLATAYSGPFGGALTAAVCATTRWWYGGHGVVAGMIGVGVDWLASLLVVLWLWRPGVSRIVRLALLGVAVGTTEALSLLLTPQAAAETTAFATFGGSLFAIQALGVLLFGAMIDLADERRALDGMLQNRLDRLDAVLRQTIDAFTKFTIHTDPYTAGHEARVTDLCVALARRIGFDDERLRGMELAAKTHDIGLMQIPSEILLRPRRLTPLEFEFVKKHPDVGWEILRSIDFPWPVANIVRQHHENFDGTGYPQGLKGEEILIEARILRVADMLEALCSHRPFRSALSLNDAMETLKDARGTALDPQIVDHCVDLVSQGGYRFPPTISGLSAAAPL
jgi:hypothetical protein